MSLYDLKPVDSLQTLLIKNSEILDALTKHLEVISKNQRFILQLLDRIIPSDEEREQMKLIRQQITDMLESEW